MLWYERAGERRWMASTARLDVIAHSPPIILLSCRLSFVTTPGRGEAFRHGPMNSIPSSAQASKESGVTSGFSLCLIILHRQQSCLRPRKASGSWSCCRYARHYLQLAQSIPVTGSAPRHYHDRAGALASAHAGYARHSGGDRAEGKLSSERYGGSDTRSTQ